MTAFDYFDSVLCINLARRRDRWAEACTEFALCGIVKYERVSAVDDSRGYRGCMASHLGVWQRIARGELGGRVLIFEDDFKFIVRHDLIEAGYGGATGEDANVLRVFDSCPGVTPEERFGAMTKFIPEHWDLLYLGGSYVEPSRARMNNHIVRNTGMSCAHAYAMSRTYASNVMQFFSREYPEDGCTEAPDTILRGLGRDPQVLSYTLSPRLFIQRESSKSDLTPRPAGFPRTMVDTFYEKIEEKIESGRNPLMGFW